MMRLPIISQIDSRDGSTDADSRMTNMLQEDDGGVVFAQLRPSLYEAATSSGNGNGVIDYGSVLISVFGTTVAYGGSITAIDTVIDGRYDFA